MVFCAKCGRGLATTSAEDPGNIPRLVWQIGDGTPQTYLLTKAVTTIGRVGGNDIILPEAGVSRQHSRLERSGTRCILVDLGSLNGTLVKNERIEQERDLVDGDVVRIGRTSLQITIRENIASMSNAPSVGTRITDSETMAQIGEGHPTLPASGEEGAATVFDMPLPGSAPATGLPAEAPGGAADEAPDADRTVAGDLDAERTVAGGDVPREEMVAAAAQVSTPQRESDAAFWLVTNDGTRLPVDEPVTVGRGEDNAIVLSQDRQVSRHHARISVDGAYLRLEDLGSANGTRLNNLKVTQPEPGDRRRRDQGGRHAAARGARGGAGPGPGARGRRPHSRYAGGRERQDDLGRGVRGRASRGRPAARGPANGRRGGRPAAAHPHLGPPVRPVVPGSTARAAPRRPTSPCKTAPSPPHTPSSCGRATR